MQTEEGLPLGEEGRDVGVYYTCKGTVVGPITSSEGGAGSENHEEVPYYER